MGVTELLLLIRAIVLFLEQRNEKKKNLKIQLGIFMNKRGTYIGNRTIASFKICKIIPTSCQKKT